MAKYAIRLEGGVCLVKVQERFLGVFHKRQIKAKGFFTTRFVEATSPDEAASKAIEAVRDEMNAFLSNDSQDLWTLSVVEVWEDAQLFDAHAPGSGCTWFDLMAN